MADGGYRKRYARSRGRLCLAPRVGKELGVIGCVPLALQAKAAPKDAQGLTEKAVEVLKAVGEGELRAGHYDSTLRSFLETNGTETPPAADGQVVSQLQKRVLSLWAR